MARYLFTLLLAFGTAAVGAAEDGDVAEGMIRDIDSGAWTASYLSAGEYIDDQRRWVAARVQYVADGSTMSISFAIRGCGSGRGDGIAWPLGRPSEVEQLAMIPPEIRFAWSDARFDSTFSQIAVKLCRLAEAEGWLKRQ